jgi:beta-N-acetylhexosaminidase
VRGLQEHGVIATAKHFPGHGDTNVDSHIDLPFIGVDRARAEEIELPPYRAAFAAGVRGVMTAHIAFPSLTGDSTPATLHPALIAGLLRRDLGFDGLVFTDALDMGAIVRRYGSGSAAVLALEAGADVLLQMLPDDVPVVIDAVVEAVASGRLSEARLDESVRRILRAKEAAGLHVRAVVPLDSVSHVLGTAAHQEVAGEAARRSITAVRNRDNLLPLRGGRVLSIVYTDGSDPYAGRSFNRELALHLPDLETMLVDGRASAATLAEMQVRADAADVVLFSPFIRVAAGRTELAVASAVAEAVNAVAARRPIVITAFGNPYVLQQFPATGSYVIAWAQWDPVQKAAARALVGLIPMDGRLPIPIPPLHSIGDGVRVDAVRTAP